MNISIFEFVKNVVHFDKWVLFTLRGLIVELGLVYERVGHVDVSTTQQVFAHHLIQEHLFVLAVEHVDLRQVAIVGDEVLVDDLADLGNVRVQVFVLVRVAFHEIFYLLLAQLHRTRRCCFELLLVFDYRTRLRSRIRIR